MNTLKTIIVTLALSLLALPSWGDNSSLKIQWSKYSSLEPCEKLIELRLDFQTMWVEDLYSNGVPECTGYDFPDEWLEKKEIVNDYAYTKCDIGCNIRQFPLMGNNSSNLMGDIKGTQRIFLDHRVTSIKGIGFWETEYPWFRHWYSFSFNGQTYYIWVDNIQRKSH